MLDFHMFGRHSQKFVEKYTERYLNSFLVFSIDIVVSVLSSAILIFMASFFVRFSRNYMLFWIFISGVVSVLSFYGLKTYRIVIRHMSLADVTKFLPFVIVKILVLFVTSYFYLEKFHIKVLLLTIFDGFLTFGLLMFIRTTMIAVYDYVRLGLKERQKRQNVFICGSKEKSISLVTRLQNSTHYNVIGFIENADDFVLYKIFGLNVYCYDSAQSLINFKRKYFLDGIIVASENDIKKYEDGLLVDAVNVGLHVLIAPSINEAVNGVVFRNHIREVKIEDLLGRPEIKISMDAIKDYFKGKVVMVTGAAGSIGSELCRQLATFGIEKLILFDNAETPTHTLRLELEDSFPDLKFIPVIGDVRLIERLDFVFRKYRPNVVFHAAAYKHVPLMEENPCEAIRVNVVGTRNVAEKCVEYSVDRMVMISTDKAVNPTNIMGCSKRIAEIYVQSLGMYLQNTNAGGTKFVTTRFGNVLGSNGSVIPRFREQIAKGGPVTVTHKDIIRFFMTIPEACRLVMEAATMTSGNQIFVFDMGDPVKIDTLARKMIKLAGLEPDKDIKIEYSGLRPGEKLYEEMLADTENTQPTTHERIRIASVREYDYSDASKYVNELDALSSNVEIDSMVRLMKSIVSEFKSSNSRFQVLDN